MIEPSFGAPLVAPVGGPSLLPAGLFAAWHAAITVSAITVRADEEDRVAPLTKAKLLPQNRFAVSHRHASSQAGTGQRQWSRGRLEPALFGLPVEWLPNTEPCRSNGRVPSISRLETRYFVPQGLVDDRTDDCAFGAMMSLALRRKFRKPRFQMIADSAKQSTKSADQKLTQATDNAVLWQQSDNVPFEQSRNVLLTAPSLGDAGRTTTDDASR